MGFKEDHLAKKSIIVKPFYLKEEKLLALSMVHKEIKFYEVSVSSKHNKLHYEELPQMTYKCSFICTSLHIARHKVSKLLIAALAGDNFTYEVVIVDRYCPNANFGGGAFG